MKGINGDKEMRLLDTIGLFKCFGLRLSRNANGEYAPSPSEISEMATLLGIAERDVELDLATLTLRIDFRPVAAPYPTDVSVEPAIQPVIDTPKFTFREMTEEEQREFLTSLPERFR